MGQQQGKTQSDDVRCIWSLTRKLPKILGSLEQSRHAFVDFYQNVWLKEALNMHVAICDTEFMPLGDNMHTRTYYWLRIVLMLKVTAVIWCLFFSFSAYFVLIFFLSCFILDLTFSLYRIPYRLKFKAITSHLFPISKKHRDNVFTLKHYLEDCEQNLVGLYEELNNFIEAVNDNVLYVTSMTTSIREFLNDVRLLKVETRDGLYSFFRALLLLIRDVDTAECIFFFPRQKKLPAPEPLTSSPEYIKLQCGIKEFLENIDFHCTYLKLIRKKDRGCNPYFGLIHEST